MRTKNLIQILSLPLHMVLISVSCNAATEVIPFSGYRLSGEFTELTSGTTLDVDDTNTKGLIINKDYDAGSQIEFLYSKQSSVLRTGNPAPINALFDIDIEYYHVGGLVLKAIDDKANSFFGAGLGLTHFSPNFSGHSSETEWSFSISGGMKREITKHLGLRFGLRFYGTPVNKNSSIFCANGGCDIRFKSNLYTQYEANLGLIIKF